MKERMQKTLSQVNGCPQRDRSETEWYGGVQTFMWMCEDNIVEVPFDKELLFEQILSPTNLNRAYKAVMRNKGCGGIDKMSCEQLLPWLMTNKDVLIRSLMDGSYRPNPVKRVEIPKILSKPLMLNTPPIFPLAMSPPTCVSIAPPVVMSPATIRLSCPIFSCRVMRDMSCPTNSFIGGSAFFFVTAPTGAKAAANSSDSESRIFFITFLVFFLTIICCYSCCTCH